MTRTWFGVVGLAVMFALSVAVWDLAPDSMPIHWSAGRPDGYASKSVGLLLLPCIALGQFVVMLLVGYRRDAQDAELAEVQTLLVLLLLGFHVALVSNALGRPVDPAILIAGLLAWLGTRLRSLRPNMLIGVRTKWTFESRVAWERSNRLASWLMLSLSPIALLLALFRVRFATEAVIAAIVTATIAVVIYSWMVWKADPDRSHT